MWQNEVSYYFPIIESEKKNQIIINKKDYLHKSENIFQEVQDELISAAMKISNYFI